MPSKKLDFKTGQYVVYPTQGVGKLLRIEEQTIAGQKIKMMASLPLFCLRMSS